MSTAPKPNSQYLANLLTDVATGRLSAADALSAIHSQWIAGTLAAPQDDSGTADMSRSRHLTLDLDRQQRCGYPEVIYGAGKPAELIAKIILAQREAGQDALATRVTAEVAHDVQTLVSGTRYNAVAKTLCAGAAGSSLPCPLPAASPLPKAASPLPKAASPLPEAATRQSDIPSHVAVITAGSTDAPVAEEAIETLHWMGINYRNFDDIGVAGPARLLAAVPLLRQASAVVVIAGMEGALPAAVGGHLHVPVFAVPTSVGYGATLGGLTPLLGMLSCCASNVAVVNIDAGFKAAYLAGLVTRPPR